MARDSSQDEKSETDDQKVNADKPKQPALLNIFLSSCVFRCASPLTPFSDYCQLTFLCSGVAGPLAAQGGGQICRPFVCF